MSLLAAPAFAREHKGYNPATSTERVKERFNNTGPYCDGQLDPTIGTNNFAMCQQTALKLFPNDEEYRRIYESSGGGRGQ